MKKVAINGFGRIGRNVVRALIETPRDDFQIVAINDLAPAETAALLLELDSTHGRLARQVLHGDGYIEVDGQRIDYVSHRDPESCEWGKRGIDLVMECTGFSPRQMMRTPYEQAPAPSSSRLRRKAPTQQSFLGSTTTASNPG